MHREEIEMDVKEIEKLLTSGNIKQFAMRLLEEWEAGKT